MPDESDGLLALCVGVIIGFSLGLLILALIY